MHDKERSSKMSPRPKMDDELVKIQDKVTAMTERVQQDIIRAVTSIKERDYDLAREIIDSGDIVDDMEDDIDESCFKFLATQAPIATDLRYSISIMKMIRDLERIGDHCEDLAKYTLRLEGRCGKQMRKWTSCTARYMKKR